MQFKIKNVKIGIMSRLKSDIWPILDLKLAILAIFFKISTSNLFCLAFTFRLIGKPNRNQNDYFSSRKATKMAISQFMTIFAAVRGLNS